MGRIETQRLWSDGERESKVRAFFLKDLDFSEVFKANLLYDVKELSKILNLSRKYDRVVVPTYYDKNKEKGAGYQFEVNYDPVENKVLFKGHLNTNKIALCEDRMDRIDMLDKKEVPKMVKIFKEGCKKVTEIAETSGFSFSTRSVVKDVAGNYSELNSKNMRSIIKESEKRMKEKIKKRKESIKKEKNERKKNKLTKTKWVNEGIYKMQKAKKEIEFNKNKAKIGKYEFECNENFNEFVEYFTLSTCHWNPFGILLKILFRKYKEGLIKNIILKVKKSGKIWKFGFKRDQKGLYFFNLRLRQNKFKNIIRYIKENQNKPVKKLRKNIKHINKFSGIKRDMLELKDVILERTMEDDVELSVNVNISDEDWILKVEGHKFVTDWKELKNMFCFGRSVIGRVSEKKLGRFLEKYSDNPYKELKEIILMAKL